MAITDGAGIQDCAASICIQNQFAFDNDQVLGFFCGEGFSDLGGFAGSDEHRYWFLVRGLSAGFPDLDAISNVCDWRRPQGQDKCCDRQVLISGEQNLTPFQLLASILCALRLASLIISLQQTWEASQEQGVWPQLFEA